MLRQIGRMRSWAERTIQRHIGPQRSALAMALLLGSRERLERAVTKTFFVSGTIHLLAISGLHVGILASVFWLLMRLECLPRQLMLFLTCGLAIGYAVLTGGRPPVVRATILIVVFCLARWTGRRAVAWNSLAAAGILTLARSPGGLMDTGTQLSFLAVASLIGAWPTASRQRLVDPLDRLIAQSRPLWERAIRRAGRALWQVVVMTTVVWLVTLPLVAHRFHLVAPIGLLLNLVLWIPVSVALFASLAVVVTSFLPGVAAGFGWVADRSLMGIEAMTSAAAGWWWGHDWVVGPPVWWLVGFYAGLGIAQFVPLRISRRWWLGLLAGWMIVSFLVGGPFTRVRNTINAAPLRVSFVAVGHGTSVLVALPGGQTILYDAGRMGSPEAAALAISGVLWAGRISHLDAIILSHADADHFNALPELLDRFSVGSIYVSRMMFQSDSTALTVLREAIDSAGVPIGFLREGDQCVTRFGVLIEVLHPPPRRCGASDNSNSLVISILHHGHRILLTGDLDSEGLEELLAEMPLDTDVLLAPHHGSRHSRPDDMLQWSSPQSVIISAGSRQPLDQLFSAVSRHRARAYWTHRDGLVEVSIDRDGLRVDAWR
jgi:competence protein ComEC